MKIYIANESTVVKDSEIVSWLPALERYASHVSAYWPRTVDFRFVKPTEIPKDTWTILLLDDSDQAGALGYHDYTPGGKPISKIFAKTDEDNGYSITVTLTHEIAEMMADPYISDLIQVTDKLLYAREICDAVERDNLGYHINAGGVNVLVSDFQTPAWFIPGHPGPKFDYANHCKQPLEILSGGYMSIFQSGKGWTQVNAQNIEVPTDAKGRVSRPAKYARSRGVTHLAKVLS